MKALFLLTSFICFFGRAQNPIKGLVIDAATNAPVPKASVFLSNTSVGTTANNDGRFELNVPSGRFDLIVSSVGYQTHNQTINANEASSLITIKLQVKAPELENIIIEPVEKDGWKNWGKWFVENFLGTSEYGRNSSIKNREVLMFRNSKKQQALTVIATAPLIIENKDLGYKVIYQLENFTYDFKTRYLFYSGYPFFENMEGSDRKKRGWEKNREDVYYGSTLHFMRALYRNKIMEEGFEVRRLQKIPNAEKERIKFLYKESVKANDLGQLYYDLNRDSTAYYDRIMSQEDFKNVVGKDLLTGDSIAYAVDSITAEVFFENYLLVIYKHKVVPAEFKRLFPKSSNEMMSEISLLNNQPLQVFSNGSYIKPDNLLSSGYWGWWEKMGTMLPLNYMPFSKN